MASSNVILGEPEMITTVVYKIMFTGMILFSV